MTPLWFLCIQPPFRFSEIGLVDFEPDKSFHAAALRRDRRISDAEKWIEHRFDESRASGTVQFNAPLCELDWKRCRVRPLFFTALNCFIRNKTSVTSATQITPARMRPSDRKSTRLNSSHA